MKTLFLILFLLLSSFVNFTAAANTDSFLDLIHEQINKGQLQDSRKNLDIVAGLLGDNDLEYPPTTIYKANLLSLNHHLASYELEEAYVDILNIAAHFFPCLNAFVEAEDEQHIAEETIFRCLLQPESYIEHEKRTYLQHVITSLILGFAEYYIYEDRLEKAEQLLKTAIHQKYEQNDEAYQKIRTRAHYLLGLTYLHWDELEKAAKELNKAQKRCLNLQDYTIETGWILVALAKNDIKRNDIVSARRNLESAKRLFASESETGLNYAKILIEKTYILEKPQDVSLHDFLVVLRDYFKNEDEHGDTQCPLFLFLRSIIYLKTQKKNGKNAHGTLPPHIESLCWRDLF